MADADDDVAGWSIKELKAFLRARGADTRGLAEKRDFVEEVRRLRAVAGTNAASSHGGGDGDGGGGGGGGGGGDASGGVRVGSDQAATRLARLIRKVEDIKSSGDGAFRAKDFKKALRHYDSAISHVDDLSADGLALPAKLVGSLFSNRSGTRETLNMHAEALDDGRKALRHRPDWPRAYSRVGAALISLRRLEEARDCYEDGLKREPGSAELQGGLSDVLQRLGSSAGGSEAASAAKQRGNAAFKAGRNEEALAAYDEAIRLAPSDETLYSNRSAALARLERFDAALADGKRAVSLRPKWGKGYSRAGLAALKGRDEEAAYWFYANGLRYEPSNDELLRGRDACLEALRAAGTARDQRRAARFEMDACRPPARVFAVSDVHYDHPGAKEWAASLSKTAYKDDTIILAGDIADTYTAVKYALKAFKAAFRRVFYVPGNHDMWIRPKGQHSDEPAAFADSVHKLICLWQLCDELDVDTGPARVSRSVTVVPLDSWYSYTFDRHDPRPGTALFDSWCKWPMGYDAAWDFMTGLNEARLKLVEEHSPRAAGVVAAPDVITFSHFLPRQELPLPGIMDMAKASGCLRIEEQLRRLRSRLHIFGHTHINTEHDLQGNDATGAPYSCKYMQNAMGYGIAPGTRLPVVNDQGRFTAYMA